MTRWGLKPTELLEQLSWLSYSILLCPDTHGWLRTRQSMAAIPGVVLDCDAHIISRYICRRKQKFLMTSNLMTWLLAMRMKWSYLLWVHYITWYTTNCMCPYYHNVTCAIVHVCAVLLFTFIHSVLYTCTSLLILLNHVLIQPLFLLPSCLSLFF